MGSCNFDRLSFVDRWLVGGGKLLRWRPQVPQVLSRVANESGRLVRRATAHCLCRGEGQVDLFFGNGLFSVWGLYLIWTI